MAIDHAMQLYGQTHTLGQFHLYHKRSIKGAEKKDAAAAAAVDNIRYPMKNSTFNGPD